MEELLAQLLQQRALQTKAASDEKHGAIIAQLRQVSERQAYEQLDQQRAVSQQVRDAVATMRRGAGMTNPAYEHIGPGSDEPIARRERIDALANKDTWTAQDLAGMSQQDIDAGRAARNARRTRPGAAGIPIPESYGIYTNPETGDKSVEMFTPEAEFGTELAGRKGLAITDLAYRHDLDRKPGDPIGIERNPVPLREQMRGRTDLEAIEAIRQRNMRLQSILSGRGDLAFF